MGGILEKISDAIKEFLMGLIESNLTNMFTDVNDKVGTIAAEVGQTPSGWNGSIYTMVRGLSDNVIVPIAGIIITLGTPATRAGIIEKLVATGFIERKGKALIPTNGASSLMLMDAGSTMTSADDVFMIASKAFVHLSLNAHAINQNVQRAASMSQ
mgnify:CR=1 FL=1